PVWPPLGARGTTVVLAGPCSVFWASVFCGSAFLGSPASQPPGACATAGANAAATTSPKAKARPRPRSSPTPALLVAPPDVGIDPPLVESLIPPVPRRPWSRRPAAPRCGPAASKRHIH